MRLSHLKPATATEYPGLQLLTGVIIPRSLLRREVRTPQVQALFGRKVFFSFFEMIIFGEKQFFRFSRKNINLAKQFFRFFGKLFKTILQNNFAKQFSNLRSQNANFGKTIFQNDAKQFSKQCFFWRSKMGPKSVPKILN